MSSEPTTAHVDRIELVRARALAIDGFYSPLLHLAATSVSGIAIVITACAMLTHVRWWDAAFGIGMFFTANFTEWCVHRFPMHRRLRFASELFIRHERTHHVIYSHDSMAIQSTGEFRVVLLKPWVVVGVAVALSPCAVVLSWLQLRNLAILVIGVPALYVLMYEWIHLACHLPAGAPKFPLLGYLQQHHARHHDHRWMHHYNFNVAFPLCDVLFRSIIR